MSAGSAAVFDLGKVLLDFDYGLVVERLTECGTSDHDGVRRLLLETPLLSDYESGRLESAAFFVRLQEGLGLRLDYREFRLQFGDIFSPIPAMIEAHSVLRNRGVPTFILSNTNEIAVAHIAARYPFYNQFNGHVLSHEIGSMKPAAPIYEALETMAGLTGTALVYLDDRPENVQAARERGWQAAVHTDPPSSIAFLRAAGLPA